MARPPLDIGEYGNISTKDNGDGFTAETRYRDVDGVSRRVRANGPTATKAENALKRKLKKRGAHGAGDIKPTTTLAVLAEAWHASRADLMPGSQDAYRHAIDRHIIPGIGQLRVSETTTGRLDRFLSGVAEPSTKTVISPKGREREIRIGGPTAAKQCRVVLSGMFNLAARHDAISQNPVREAAPAARKRRAKVRALTMEEFHALRARVAEWLTDGHYGPARSPDLLDVVDAFIATGVRPGEVLAFLWDDVVFKGDLATVEVTGTIKRTKARGLHRQELPKSEAGERVLMLPPFAASMLRRRKLSQPPNPLGLVFPSRTGGPREPNNFNRVWRQARGEEFAWVEPRSFRPAVATLIQQQMGSAFAARQLGHSSEAITERYYIERDTSGPDARQLLERFRNGG